MKSWVKRVFSTREFIDDGIQVHPNPVINQIYKMRGISSPTDYEYQLKSLLDPFTMKGMEDAVNVLIELLQESRDKKIVYIGDFDCDGATATTIGVEGLRMLGFNNVDFVIPERKQHGYGLSIPIVHVAAQKKPDLIITVDNGITSIDGVNEIHSLDHPCKVIITDHHLPAGDTLPAAEAIVNPNQPGCSFESKDIAGCGVIFYVMLGLRARMTQLGLFEKLGIERPNMSKLLDVLTLGTVADVVKLDKNNRIIVDAGLKMINAGYVRPGMKAILDIAKRNLGSIVASDMGFAIGPRMNAAGRLDDMSRGVQCLLEKDEDRAREIAQQLNDLNEERKEIQRNMTEDAAIMIEESDALEKYFAIAIYLPDGHEGVMGITAGQGKEKTNRPFVCFAPAKEEGQLKGSGRSVNGVNLRHVLDEINASDPNIFVKYGGHAMAAGMQIYKDKLDDFQHFFDKAVRNHLTEEMIRGDVTTDMVLKGDDITLEMADLIKGAGPWGSNFEEPVFGGRFIVERFNVLKDIHLKLFLKDPVSEEVFEAISFGCVEDGIVPVEVGNEIDVSYNLSVNEFRGRRTLQLMIRDLQDEIVCEKMLANADLSLSISNKDDFGTESKYAKKEAKSITLGMGM